MNREEKGNKTICFQSTNTERMILHLHKRHNTPLYEVSFPDSSKTFGQCRRTREVKWATKTKEGGTNLKR